jgi:CheY-like chemotaxis protein
MLRRLIGEDLMLAVVLDPKLPRIKADPGQIEQILMNLVVNARDAMPNGGRLTIETRAMHGSPGDSLSYPDLSAGDYAQLSVSDTGLGMDEEVKSRIFEPFYTTKGVGKGTGLGLSVVHGVITQCGGRVDVESAPGQGTTFSLLFPAVNESALEHEHEGTRREANGTETVLLVEDDINVRTVAKIALESKGYTVLEASCGAAAVQIAEDAPASFDILVTDVVMPEMGGRQLAQQLRTRLPNLRVLFISGYTGEAVFKYGPSEPTDGFLQKPFTPQALARMVRSVLDGRTGVAPVSNGVAGRNALSE